MRRGLTAETGAPEAGFVAEDETADTGFFGFGLAGRIVEDGGAPEGEPGVGSGGEGGGPGDVAMAGGIEGIGCFTEVPAVAVKVLAEGEEVGGDVLVRARKTFFGHGKLVHEREAEVMLAGGEVDGEEAVGEFAGSFPADLAAQAGRIAGGFDARKFAQEMEEDSFQEVPILGADGEESAEPEFGAAGFVEVEGGEVALAGGGDVEAETARLEWWRVGVVE